MKTAKMVILLTLALIRPLYSADDWKVIFNGKTLDGWEQLNGSARYYVEGGDIVGETVFGSVNSFLCTADHFSDFILEFEVKLEAAVNSGVQIRSRSLKDFQNGRVHGYQVEIDPTARAWTGGIYDEARRGWLYNLERNPAGQKAFRMGEWNHIRVEAIGNSIRTWVNGIHCSDLVDEMTPSGFIGLQVHSIGNKADEGGKIRWRNIRIMTGNPEANRKQTDPGVPEISFLNNELTDREKKEGWVLLWDGKTSGGWRGANLDHFPEKGWESGYGMLTVIESGGREAGYGGDIVTIKKYRNFILEVDFMITRGANSGIKYFVDTNLNKTGGSAIGCEFQILDDANHADAEKGINGNRTLASLYDLIPARTHERLDGKKRFNGVGNWNRARIVVKDCHVEHWLNNEMVAEYERCSPMWRELVANSKYRIWPGFGEAKEGHILLQDHGNRVSFRNIKLLELE